MSLTVFNAMSSTVTIDTIFDIEAFEATIGSSRIDRFDDIATKTMGDRPTAVNPVRVWRSILCEVIRLMPSVKIVDPEDASISELVQAIERGVSTEVALDIAFTGNRTTDYERIADRVADLAFVLAITEDLDASIFLSGRAAIVLYRLIGLASQKVH